MGRDDLDVVVAGVRDLVAMPSAGDLVIYRHASHVSFIPEQSAPAGPSREELHTFIIHPDRVRLPAPIVHPVQLYPGVRRVWRVSTSDARSEPRRASTVVARTSPLCIFYNRRQEARYPKFLKRWRSGHGMQSAQVGPSYAGDQRGTYG